MTHHRRPLFRAAITTGYKNPYQHEEGQREVETQTGHRIQLSAGSRMERNHVRGSGEALAVLPVFLRQINSAAAPGRDNTQPASHNHRSRTNLCSTSNLCSILYIIKGVGGKGLRLSR